METQRNLGMDLARILSRAARDKAREIKVPMVIAFTDARGELILFQRMDKALPASTDIAVNKAFTAAALRLPTHKAGVLSRPGQPLYGLTATNGGRMVVFGGGFPLTIEGEVVGAVGISGGSVEEDMEVGSAVLDALDGMKQAAKSLENLLPEALATPETITEILNLAGRTDGISPDLLEGAMYLLS